MNYHMQHITQKLVLHFGNLYVEYIYQHGGYGEKSFTNSGIISLSEAWAEDASNRCAYYIYKQQKIFDRK